MQQNNAAAATTSLCDQQANGVGPVGDASDAVMSRWLQSAGLQHLASPLTSADNRALTTLVMQVWICIPSAIFTWGPKMELVFPSHVLSFVSLFCIHSMFLIVTLETSLKKMSRKCVAISRRFCTSNIFVLNIFILIITFPSIVHLMLLMPRKMAVACGFSVAFDCRSFACALSITCQLCLVGMTW